LWRLLRRSWKNLPTGPVFTRHQALISLLQLTEFGSSLQKQDFQEPTPQESNDNSLREGFNGLIAVHRVLLLLFVLRKR